MAEPKAAASFKVPWRCFDPERRARVTEAVQHLLRTKKRTPSECAAIVRELEMWAAGHKRHPKDSISDAERRAGYPPEIARKARALHLALSRRITPPTRTTLADLAGLSLRSRLETRFGAQDWATFEWILESFASAALERGAPRDERLRSLERKVLEVLNGHGLSWRTNEYAADILAEIKAHALNTPYPESVEARIAALRRAVANVEGP